MTQYDRDSRGEFTELFKKVRKLLLGYPQIKELKNAHQTSYSDEYGVILMIRPKGDRYVLAFGKGATLQKKYPILEGDGKIVRHLYVKNPDEVDEVLLREMIEESFVLGMEAFEMKQLKANLK